MKLYKNAEMENFYASADASAFIPCQVRIGDTEIAVSYHGDSGPLVYTGHAKSPGHYKLECKDIAGRATLHLNDDGDSLEGSWIESGYEGMWRIELNDE